MDAATYTIPPTPTQDEHEAMKLRAIELEAEIAERSRAFHVDGKPTSEGKRAELWAELKTITLQLHRLNIYARDEKKKANAFKHKAFLNLLIRKCEDIGRGDLVAEANAESLAALTAAGMLDAYSA